MMVNLLLGAASLWLWLLAAVSSPAHGAGTDRPNIVLVLTDDQDAYMKSIEHMPKVQEHLVKKGTTFAKHYCTVSLCCPSRVNLWTGQMAHNTNVTNVSPPYGGYPKFIDQGYNDHHLALWMQKESNYNTYYVGKLFNAHSVKNYNKPHMSGYTGSEFFLEPYTYHYFNVGSSRNGNKPHFPKGYSTDLVSEYGTGFLKEAFDEPEKPFFLTLATVAPHAYLRMGKETKSGPPPPAPRHRHMFKDYKIPRTKNFNPDRPSGANWVAKLPKLTDKEVEKNDEEQIKRLQALQAVDDMVDEVVHRLDKAGVLNNTYIIYTSDNGYHISQHRMKGGKMCGYETDINVPFVVRGPGVAENEVRQDPHSHTDLAPTIMKLAGNSIDDKKFDGSPIDLWEAPETGRSEHVSVEFWGHTLKKGPGSVHNNTYKSLRIEAEKYSLYYSVWCNNEKEMYDMKDDYDQMDNLLAEKGKMNQKLMYGQSVSGVADRLDALLMILKGCKESSCTDPWKTLHPDGSVKTLEDALDSRFNDFYRDQIKVEFVQCEPGYIVESEGPQSSEMKAWSDESSASRMGMVINPYWHWWE